MREVAVVFDPHVQFLPRYYDANRGDVILNPLHRDCCSWSPSDEIDFSDRGMAEANAMAQASSLFPGRRNDRNWFFTYTCRLIWQHLIVNYRPDAAEMAELMKHADPLIDFCIQGTELETMMIHNAPQQRAGVVSSLTQIAFSLRQIPKKQPGRPHLVLRDWCNTRHGWIYLTNSQDTRDALRPLQSMWLDWLIVRLLSMGERKDLPAVLVAIDELQTLQELPQLMPLVTEGRKSLRVLIGFQGRSQIKALYGEEAEAIFSAPFTKFLMRTSEPEAAKWVSDIVGEVEREYVRVTRSRTGHSYITERRIDKLVLPSEFKGLPDRHGYLSYGNSILKVKLPIMPKIVKAPGFIPRESEPVARLPLPSLEKIKALQKELQESKAKQKQPSVEREPAVSVSGMI